MIRRKKQNSPGSNPLRHVLAVLFCFFLLASLPSAAQTPTPPSSEQPPVAEDNRSEQIPSPSSTSLSDVTQETAPVEQPSPAAVSPQPTAPAQPDIPSPAPVAKSAPTAPNEYESYIDLGTVVWKMIRALLVVLALIALSVWAFKKFFRKSTLTREHALTRVVGRVYLNPKTVIYLVRVMDRILVVGTNSNTIQLLTEIREPELVTRLDRAPASAPGTSGQDQPFASYLNKLQGTSSGAAGSPSTASDIEHHIEEIRKQISKLEKFSKELEGEE